MNRETFLPTEQQRIVIGHEGSAFIAACPGAGKTRVMAERARHIFTKLPAGRGIAFLSFTHAAVFELGTRLRQLGILPSPVFPSFIGTFDSFVWQFLIAPFGLKDIDLPPRLIPDIDEHLLRPFGGAHPLPLSCFDPGTHSINQDAAKRRGFNVHEKPSHQTQAYQTAAKNLRDGLRRQGCLGFDQARQEALARLRDADVSRRLASALAGRFLEVIVDEAQDCNPDDLQIVSWLRQTGVDVKVVCDPQQSIYEFRGGVTDHLLSFANTFATHERKELTGNFRSTPNICKVIAQLRPSNSRASADDALSSLGNDFTPVYIFRYPGRAVPPSIGREFSRLLQQLNIDIANSPVVAATRASAAAAVGQPRPSPRRDRSVRLAEAVTDFYFSSGFHDVKATLQSVHALLLELEDRLVNTSYDQYVSDNDIEPVSWRPLVIRVLQELQFDPSKHKDARTWHAAAKDVLSRNLTIPENQSISQRLKWNAAIEGALVAVKTDTAMSRTIHSVKGMEFPAVCVVTTASTLGGILDFLENEHAAERAEDARKLYVAASRAQRLLVIAAPKSQADRLARHLQAKGANVQLSNL